MKGADLTKSELPRANLAEANLTNADLSKSELGRAKMKEAKLDGAKFQYAYLARAVLHDASLKGTDFTGSYLFLMQIQGVDLSQAIGLTHDQLALACGDADTKLPDGVQRPEAWPCSDSD